MGPIERAWFTGVTRRNALAALGGMLAGSPTLLQGQLDPRDLRNQRRFPGIDEMTDVFDFEEICYANVPRQLYDFTAHGADSEWTVRRNRQAMDWVQILEGTRVPAERVDASTEILGIRMNYPIIVAPTAFQIQMHPSAEGGMYQAATATGTLMAVSHNATMPQEEIAAAATGPRWIQLYPSQNPQGSQNAIQRYQDAGAQAIIITIDQQATRYDRQDANRRLGGNVVAPAALTPPAQPLTELTGTRRYGLPPGRMWYTWDNISQLRDFARVPLLIKGILTGRDAAIAVDRGFDGVIVSNHGGRSMDYGPSTLEILEEVVQAVNGRVPVIVDSGFRRGSDAFKALALGADAVSFGRATRWGLGAFGPAGAQRVLEILQNELRETMASTGRATLAAVDRTAIRTDFQ